jgi:hypothetical protein
MGAVKLFIDKGANPFFRDLVGESAIAHYNGEHVLEQANDLIWESARPLLLLSKACSLAADYDASPVLLSVLKVFGILGIVRDYIAPYVGRSGIIVRDPEEDDESDDEEEEPDEVKMRIEAGLAAASSTGSGSSSSSNKRAREE